MPRRGGINARLAYDFFRFLKRPLTDVSIPTGARWIPKGMSVEYLAKADGDIRTVAAGSAVDWDQTGDIKVPVIFFQRSATACWTAIPPPRETFSVEKSSSVSAPALPANI